MSSTSKPTTPTVPMNRSPKPVDEARLLEVID
jgi:hypothetical protein